MKTFGSALLVSLLFVFSSNKKSEPLQVKEIKVEKTKTFEEIMVETKLYQRTLGIEDTIQKTKIIIEEIKEKQKKKDENKNIRIEWPLK